MLRTLSPSGAPLKLYDVFQGILSELRQDNSIAVFEEAVRTRFGAKHVFLFSSGKVSLFIALRALASISERRDVVIPAYSSFCLASSVAKAGLRVKLCDVDPEYLDFDLDHLRKLVDRNTLAVIPVHLFGYVARLNEITDIARSVGASILEDAAQAMGAEYNNRPAGTIGDAGIFSLGRGKAISTVAGGILLSNSDTLRSAVRMSVSPPRPLEFVQYAAIGLAMSIFLDPNMYTLPNSLSFLNLGVNIYESNFEGHHFTRFQAGVGNSILDRMDLYNNIRVANTSLFLSTLCTSGPLRMVRVTKNSHPIFTRVPIVCNTEVVRDRLFCKLKEAGLGASRNYPCPLSKIPDFKDRCLNCDDPFPHSDALSKTILTIPSHPYVSNCDIYKMLEIIHSELGG
ncbi:MAG: DegT/DnrJ/EryC1/StrS family aminotransferase [Smithellaceae bacterium]